MAKKKSVNTSELEFNVAEAAEKIAKSAVEKEILKKNTENITPPKKEKNIQTLAMKFINDPGEKTFNALAERINWGLRGYVFKIVKDNDATTDVVSKTLEALYFKREQYNPDNAKFSTWMYRIAFNFALKYLQQPPGSQGKLNIDFEDIYDSTLANDSSDGSGLSAFTSSDDIIDMVYDNNEFVSYDKEKVISDFYDASVKSIQDLPDNLRVVMYDRLVNEKKIEDIAYDNYIPVSSVKNWLRKGKAELQEIIKNNYTELYDMYMEVVAC